MRIILASGSPQRREALDLLGIDFEVISPDIDEKSIRDEDARVMVRMIAEAKARAVAASEGGLVIAGDLFVVMDGKVYEKPASSQEGVEMLKGFSGKTMQIISATAVLADGKMISISETCDMRFRELSDQEIRRYVESCDVTRFAGAFDQKGYLLFADHVCGDYNFEKGFGAASLVKLLRKQGVDV